jgi:hypothetical protein
MGEKVTGRKRHILVDTQGNLVVVIVHAANIADRERPARTPPTATISPHALHAYLKHRVRRAGA